MTVKHRIIADLYKDSVALMVISSRLLNVDGIDAASVVMATPTNVENLVHAGLGGHAAVRTSDVIVAVAGIDSSCDAALELAATLFAEQPARNAGAVAVAPPTSLQSAIARDPAASLALVSVPGEYAAGEAMKALRLGLHVMIFSDNVAVHHERSLKQYAASRGLLVMGPDCGTAIVNGLPLGFANVVRRGTIGVVGASGTGMQEITSRIHNLGGGISQALGTGGHDLSDEIGGISMLQAMRALEHDPDTEVLVLVSKPPAAGVARVVLDEVRAMRTPVVVMFLGADPATFDDGVVRGARSLANAADIAVALAIGQPASSSAPDNRLERRRLLDDAVARMAPGQRFVRGIFCGGTFCYEAQLVCLGEAITGCSNTPVAGNTVLSDVNVSREHTFLDMGDDAFTQGRPHPMIDPTLRNERVARDAADAETAVLLVDIVLGYGSAADPASELLAVIGRAQVEAAQAGRHLAVISHVCGTDADPQDRTAIVAQLDAAGVLVASSNAEAARWAAYVANGLVR